MYVVDANVLIEAKNRYYAFDLAPGFWKWLERVNEGGAVCSIDPIFEEIIKGDDELKMWAREHRSFFCPIGQGPVKHFSRITQWAVSQNYSPAALSAFTGNDADYLIIAYACAYNCTVVTHEIPAPSARKRVKIPDACKAMGVDFTEPFTMLRKSGAQLILA